MGNWGPHPVAIQRTSDEARRGRSELDRRLLRDPERVVRTTAELLAGPPTEYRDRFMQSGFDRIYAAYSRRDWELNTLLLDRDEYVFKPGDLGQAMPDAREEYVGAEAYLDAIQTFLESWRDLRVQLDGLVFADDGTVVSLMRWRGTGRRSGIPLDQKGIGEHVFRDGLVLSQTYWWSEAAYQRALGQRPGATRR